MEFGKTLIHMACSEEVTTSYFLEDAKQKAAEKRFGILQKQN